MGLVSCKLFNEGSERCYLFHNPAVPKSGQTTLRQSLNVSYGAIEVWGRVEGETIEQTDVMASGGLHEIVY